MSRPHRVGYEGDACRAHRVRLPSEETAAQGARGGRDDRDDRDDREATTDRPANVDWRMT